MSLQEQFQSAQQRVRALSKTPPPAKLLEIYALYKQGTVGDVQGKRPGMLDVKGRAKYDAWAATKGLSPDTAMRRYVELVDALVTSERS